MRENARHEGGVSMARFLCQGLIVFIGRCGVKTNTAMPENLPHERAVKEDSNTSSES